ncbi:hypothetical protein ACFVR2_11280 [Gottfriedia sp. NPDC057991]
MQINVQSFVTENTSVLLK